VKLPKLGWVGYRKSREVVGSPCQITVGQRVGRWSVSIQVEHEVADPPVHASEESVGIDLGIAAFATLSDGTRIEPLHSFRKHERRLAWYQRRLARKRKGSRNAKKEKAKVQRLQARIADARKDFLDKHSTAITTAFRAIALEDLDIKSMSASARGTQSAPGRNVRRKSRLNKAILDQGWGGFRRMLEYKAAWWGGQVVAVPPEYTSQTCPLCAHISPDNRRSQAIFLCLACGYADHADHVGAVNILCRAGLARCACSAGNPAGSEPCGSNLPTEVLAGTVSAGGMPGILGL
jgi:putative transposase